MYKELTKGKASPMGGVAYLSLEDSEVCHVFYDGLSLLLIVNLFYPIRNRTMVGSNIMQCHP